MKNMNRVFKRAAVGMMAVSLGVTALTGCSGSKEVESLEDFATYAKEVNEIEIPENVRIVGLGEATHGNVEFQELKKTVMQQLVETTDIRAFVLEGDFGGCAMANDYVLYGEGTSEEATKHLGFEIYATDQMQELLEWMREYNESAADEDKIRFYGMDLQRAGFGAEHLMQFFENAGSEKSEEFSAEFKRLFDIEGTSQMALDDTSEYEPFFAKVEQEINDNKDAYVEAMGSERVDIALEEVESMRYHVEVIGGKDSSYQELRDADMFKTVKWILEHEEARHDSGVLISCHNGHMTKNISSNYVSLGSLIYEEFGDEYFAIGTDYYNTECSFPTETARENHTFCSNDPMAASVKDMDGNVYYLDFEEAKESTELSEVITKNISTGSLGESYTPLMEYLPNTRAIFFAPEKMYDGMIFVYDATPISVWYYEDAAE